MFGDRGSYVIDSVIGRGGFGITYLAYASGTGDDDMPERVAVKEFFPKEMCSRSDEADSDDLIVNSPELFDTVTRLRARFVKESRNIQECNYPGIVKVLDTIECNGTAYMVMELIDGLSLKQLMQQSSHPDGLLPPQQAADYIIQLARGLQYLHSLGITHLDVKPDNLMVERNTGRLVLIDFGLSRRYNADGSGDSELLTALTKGYAAPEQYYGVTHFSPQSDIYSMGATFYKLLTGITPPEPAQLREDPTLLYFPGFVPRNFREAIMAAMVLVPERRLSSASRFEEIVRYGLPPVEVPAPARPEKTNRFAKFIFNTLLLALLFAAVWMFVPFAENAFPDSTILTSLDAQTSLVLFFLAVIMTLLGITLRNLTMKVLNSIIVIIIELMLLIAYPPGPYIFEF